MGLINHGLNKRGLLLFVNTMISAQNTNLHLKVDRSGLGTKLSVLKPKFKKISKVTITASIYYTGLKGNIFV